MTTTVDLTCAGPHVTPVALGTVTYPAAVTTPHPPRVLCSSCAAVYADALDQPATVDQVDNAGKPVLDPATGKPVQVPNPDHVPPGTIPSAVIVRRRNVARDPSWTPPPHNYRDPGARP